MTASARSAYAHPWPTRKATKVRLGLRWVGRGAHPYWFPFTSQAKRPSEFGQCRQQLVRPAEHLDHDMVGAGPQMLVQALGDVVGGAVGDQGLDEFVAAGR